MSPVVVDMSLAVKWVLVEERSREARLLLGEWERQGVGLIVPSWFACEVANVLYQRVRRDVISLPDAKRGLRDILTTVTIEDIDATVAFRALEFADRFRQPASYDAHYLALAERLGLEFWTADEKFWNSTRRAGPWVRWIGEVAFP